MIQGQVLLEPDLHDGSLSGVVVFRRSQLRLYCSDAARREYELHLDALVAVKADNFLPRNLVKRAFGLEPDSEPEWLNGKIESLVAQRATLVEVTSSYGCELVAIGRSPLRVRSLARNG